MSFCIVFQDIFEVQADSLSPGKNILVVDDLLATGGNYISQPVSEHVYFIFPNRVVMVQIEFDTYLYISNVEVSVCVCVCVCVCAVSYTHLDVYKRQTSLF